MNELILTFLLIIFTLGVIWIVKFALYRLKRCKAIRPKIDLTIYCDDLSMLEMHLQRLISMGLFKCFEVRLKISLSEKDINIDYINYLSQKLDVSFDIINK